MLIYYVSPQIIEFNKFVYLLDIVYNKHIYIDSDNNNNNW